MSDTSNFKALAFVRNCIIVTLFTCMVECIYSTITDENGTVKFWTIKVHASKEQYTISVKQRLENHSTKTSNFYPFSKNTKFFGNN